MYKRIFPKNATLERARGLYQTHKDFIHLSKFRPVIDVTSSTHHPAGEYLSKMFKSLTINDYNVKDSFNDVNCIKNISPEIFDEGCSFASFDFETLLPNVSL